MTKRVVLACVLPLFAWTLQGAAKTWTGSAGDPLFSSANNWSPSGAPSAGSYGSASSSAQNKSSRFTGSGILNVLRSSRAQRISDGREQASACPNASGASPFH